MQGSRQVPCLLCARGWVAACGRDASQAGCVWGPARPVPAAPISAVGPALQPLWSRVSGGPFPASRLKVLEQLGLGLDWGHAPVGAGNAGPAWGVLAESCSSLGSEGGSRPAATPRSQPGKGLVSGSGKYLDQPALLIAARAPDQTPEQGHDLEQSPGQGHDP